MEKINDAVANNLKQLREQRKLSLDALAKLSGVSKSMLAQIERGEANPTISTVWKIANGLKISFSQLITKPEQDIETVDLSGLPFLAEDGGRYRIRPIFPYDETRKFELYQIELDPGGSLAAAAHPPGTQEYITVHAGELTVTVNGETYRVNPQQALRFKADVAHHYHNQGAETCLLNMVIAYSL